MSQPSPGGWGTPPPQNNPYAPPTEQSNLPGPYDMMPVEQGSMGLGIALGFFLGLWGLLGAYVFAKPLTKKGAGRGFLARIVITLLVVIIAVLLD